MSDTDPYAGPTIEEAKTVEKPEQEAPVETPVEASAEPTVETQEVPEGTIKTVLQWVDGDKDRAQIALDAEKAGQDRTTLVKELEEIIN